MKYILLVLVLVGCKTQSQDNECFRQPYLLVNPSPELSSRDSAVFVGIHFWNTLGAHVRLPNEPLTPEETYCFNFIGTKEVPLSLNDEKDIGWDGLYHYTPFGDSASIQIRKVAFDIYSDLELIHVVAHEIGHALDIDHVNDVSAIMYPWTTNSVEFAPQDVAAFLKAWDEDYVKLQEPLQ